MATSATVPPVTFVAAGNGSPVEAPIRMVWNAPVATEDNVLIPPDRVES